MWLPRTWVCLNLFSLWGYHHATPLRFAVGWRVEIGPTKTTPRSAPEMEGIRALMTPPSVYPYWRGNCMLVRLLKLVLLVCHPLTATKVDGEENQRRAASRHSRTFSGLFVPTVTSLNCKKSNRKKSYHLFCVRPSVNPLENFLNFWSLNF